MSQALVTRTPLGSSSSRWESASSRSATAGHRRRRRSRPAAEPVTGDYPGQAPWPFTGGTIHQAVIDVSGEPFVDLAAEAQMAFLRD